MKFLARLLLVAMLVLPFTASAQSIPTPEDIEEAFAALFQKDSVRLTGSVVLDQTVSVPGFTTQQAITQDLDGVMTFADGELTGLKASIVQGINASQMGQVLEGSMLMEMVFLDNTFYVKVSDATSIFMGMFPEGWINVSESPSDMPGMEMLNMEELLRNFQKPLLYPLNAETVTEITPVDIDPELALPEGTMGYALTINVGKAFELGEIANMLAQFGEMGVDMDDMLKQMAEGAQLAVTVYISDGVVVRLEAVLGIDVTINLMGQAVELEQVATSTFTYSDFNEPVEITAPEM